MKRRLILGLFLLFLAGVDAMATHLRAGEITAVRISQTSLRYRFTLVIYRDTESGVNVGETGIFNFGQGRVIGGSIADLELESVSGFRETTLGNNTSIVVIQFEHTFDGPGVYVVSYTEQNRNAEIINMGNASSENIPFHVETVIRIDPGLDVNGTPQLTIPPIDRACVGSKFFHNPGAFDPDGDSLAYKIVNPLQDRGVPVLQYVSLDDPNISNIRENNAGPAEYSIDPITGTLVWDAPQFAGEYNLAFIVEEWRFSQLTGRYELLGYVTRDMQVVVEDCDNERPELEIPADTCVEAGDLLNALVIGRDPDDDPILMEAFGGVFELNNSPAEYLNLPDSSTNPRFRGQPVENLFRWQTIIDHVRERPYEVQFKVSDEPVDPLAPSLVDFGVWNINVIAPAPTGLNGAINSGTSIQLVWDDYIAANFAPVMQVYRRVDSFDFTPEGCNVGIPANSGYELIEELPINQTSYIDDNDVRPGVKYCYRLVTQFPQPTGGISYASTEFCIDIPLDVPAITNVSIEESNDTNGEIFVRWTSPLEIDQTLFPPPFRYELFRYNGFIGTGGRTLLTSTMDTVFTDTGLNTQDDIHNYQVRFYDRDDNLIDSSSTASSLRLEARGELQSVRLDWQAEVPWSNQVQSAPFHYVYRNRTDATADDVDNFVLIDSTNAPADGLTYLDDGRFNGIPLSNDREYCYFVTAKGSYGNPIIPSPLLNNSQIICVMPNDDIPPEDPDITPTDTTTVEGPFGPIVIAEGDQCELLEFESCGFASFTNTVTWEVDNVDGDIAFFNVYYSNTSAEDDYTIVGTSRINEFEHRNLPEIKGCYRISAVDRSGNESGLSDPICFDNCPYYELPNTFTPNGDGINDTFRAFDQPNGRCPRFVESVVVQVFDRWGGREVFSYNTDEITGEPNIFIDWDGTDNNGVELASGTYYYSVTVTFSVLDQSKRVQEFKNWVKIIR